MALLRSDGITHAVRVVRPYLRWRALCGCAFMIEGDPLPAVLTTVDCIGCIDSEDPRGFEEARPLAA